MALLDPQSDGRRLAGNDRHSDGEVAERLGSGLQCVHLRRGASRSTSGSPP
jgi:hypothetical protein